MPEPREVSSSAVLGQVAAAVPKELHEHIVVIGSLAAAYWLLEDRAVRTKDVDSVISPRVSAVDKGTAIAEKLLASGWRVRTEGDFGKPGTAEMPEGELPALRLYPPDHREWFFELLTEPEPDQETRAFMRFVVNGGKDHFGLPSFRFTGVATFEAGVTAAGIRCALPEMMALANLLEHPEIRPDLVKDTGDKRSNKDLGRAIAIARLSDPERVEEWPGRWLECMRARFPAGWPVLAARAGSGLRALVDSPVDLQQAAQICNRGMLAFQPVTAAQLRTSAERLMLVVREIETAR